MQRQSQKTNEELHEPLVVSLNKMTCTSTAISVSMNSNPDVMEAWPLLCGSPNRQKSFLLRNESTNKTDMTPLKKVKQKYDSYKQKSSFPKYGASIKDIQKIVENDPNWVQVQDVNGFLPIHYALATGKPDITIIRYLFEKYPESLTVATKFGNTPLHQACCYHSTSLEIIQFLVEKCPWTFTMFNKLGETPLDIAKMSLSCPRNNSNLTKDNKLQWLEEQKSLRTTANNTIYKDLLTKPDLWIGVTSP